MQAQYLRNMTAFTREKLAFNDFIEAKNLHF